MLLLRTEFYGGSEKLSLKNTVELSFADHRRLDVTLVDAAQDAKRSVLTPPVAPGIKAATNHVIVNYTIQNVLTVVGTVRALREVIFSQVR